jgi:hypothetical protein
MTGYEAELSTFDPASRASIGSRETRSPSWGEKGRDGLLDIFIEPEFPGPRKPLSDVNYYLCKVELKFDNNLGIYQGLIWG